MTINPVAAALHSGAASINATGQPKDGDGDHGVEPAAASTAQPSRPSNSTVSTYA